MANKMMNDAHELSAAIIFMNSSSSYFLVYNIGESDVSLSAQYKTRVKIFTGINFRTLTAI